MALHLSVRFTFSHLSAVQMNYVVDLLLIFLHKLSLFIAYYEWQVAGEPPPMCETDRRRDETKEVKETKNGAQHEN